MEDGTAEMADDAVVISDAYGAIDDPKTRNNYKGF